MPVSPRIMSASVRTGTRPSLSRAAQRKGQRVLRAVIETLEMRRLLSGSLVVNVTGDPTSSTAGQNSLREAIAYAESLGGGTITFDSTVFASPQTITLGGTELELAATTNPIIVDASGTGGVTLSGNSASRIFQVDANANLTIDDLDLTAGNGVGTSISGYGGAILNSGTITINDSTIANNAALGDLRQNDSAGGGIFSTGVTNITNSTINKNSAAVAGNIYTSTYGGGIFVGGGSLNITNSTITGNGSASNDLEGGGIDVGDADFPTGGGTVSIVDSTITGNIATYGGGIVWNGSSGQFGLRDTILAANTASGAGADAYNYGGSFTDNGGNLIGIAGTGSYNTGFTAGTTQTGTLSEPLNPALGPLASNGGPTQTLALQSGSPAIGAGAAVNGITTDQRGFPRPGGSAPDVGAFEYLKVASANPNLPSASLPNGGLFSVDFSQIADQYGDAISSNPGVTIAEKANGNTLATDQGTSNQQFYFVAPGGGSGTIELDATFTYAGTTSVLTYEIAYGLAAPTINSAAQPASATVGSPIADTATVTGGSSPTGTVTFNLYSNANATGTPLYTDTESLVNGTASSKNYTPTATGTDYWVATYNGDSNNTLVSTGDAADPVAIGSLVVNTTSDSANPGSGLNTLRQAIACADSLGAGTHAITFGDGSASGGTNFTDGTAHTIQLTSALPDLASNITITGPAANLLTINGEGQTGGFRVFTIDSGDTVTLSGMTISNGYTSGLGAGIDNKGSLTINACTISNNATAQSSEGGGIYSDGPLTINNSTLTGNTARYGGGIEADQGNLTITNSTFSGNGLANEGAGGAMDIGSGTGSATLTDCTITNNQANEGGGISFGSLNTTINAYNTILSGNTAKLDPDLVDLNGVGGTLSAASSNNIVGGNALLAPLGNYGGPTQTVALLAGSPAIGAGASVDYPGTATPITNDQRGAPRPATPDIGAYQYNLVVDSSADNVNDDIVSGSSVTLREAVNYENANGGGGITFDPTVFATAQTITLSSTFGSLELSNANAATTITGPSAGVTISGNNAVTDFVIDGGTVALSNLTISHGYSDTADGAGGIYNDGTLTIMGCTFSNDSAGDYYGGGIKNGSSGTPGTLTVSGSTFTNDSAGGGDGGGIYNFGGTLILSGSTFTNDSAGEGGGIYNSLGFAAITNCTFYDNQASSAGGGIFGGSFTLLDSTLTDNFAPNGGGIASEGRPTLGDTIVAGNTSDGDVGPDIFNIVRSIGNNLVGNGDGGGGLTNGSNGDQVGTEADPINPLLGTLGYYGGATQTVPLLPGSPAIGAGNTTAGTSTIEKITVSGNSDGSVQLGFEGNYITLDYATAIDPSNLEQSLDNLLATVDANADVDVQAASDQNQTYVFNVEFDGDFADQVEPLFTVSDEQDMTVSVSSLVAGGTPTTDQTGYTRSTTTPSIGAYENEGFTIAATGGTSQSAAVSAPFATALGVKVSSNNTLLTDLGGGVITFSAPSTGASASFGTNPIILAADGTGSTTATANSTGGGAYTVSATGAGVTNTAGFSLTNIAATDTITGADYLVSNTITAGSFTTATTGIPIAGTTVTLTGKDEFGNPVSETTTTAANGQYSFNGLYPSDGSGYTITETPPTGDSHLGQVSSTIGAATNTPPGTPAVVSGIVLIGGSSTDNFLEVSSVSIAGADYLVSASTVPTSTTTGTPIVGTTITLAGTDEFGNAVSQTTRTNASGQYSFPGLNPSNSSGYSVTETLPTGDGHVGQTSTTSSATTTPPTTLAVTGIALSTNGASSTDNFFDAVAVAPTGQFTGTPSASTTASYNNAGNTYLNVFDGNTSTFFDSPNANGNWVQLDLGAAKTITQIAYAPRQAFETRVIGGVFEASNDPTFATGVVTLYTVTGFPPDGLTNISVNPGGTYRYVRYVAPNGSYGNIAEMQVFGPGGATSTTPTYTQLTGTALASTSGSYDGKTTDNYTAAFDGNLNTFFDAPSGNGNWVELNLGSPAALGQIAFSPRQFFESRMVGGYFEASNDPNFGSGVAILYTIGSAPQFGLTTLPVSGTYQYVRYVSPNGSYGNIAEFQVFGSANSVPPAVPTPPGTPTLVGVTGTTATIQWTGSSSSDVTGYIVLRNGSQVGTTAGNMLTYTDTGLNPSSKYQYTVEAVAGGVDSSATAALPVTTSAATSSGPVQLSGIASANTSLSYGNDPNATYAAAFDGNTNTFFDSPTANGNWVQLNFGTPETITKIAYAPRVGFEYRMVGGYFEASNDPTFTTGVVTLYTITGNLADGLQSVSVSAGGTYQYVRYVAPSGSYGNIAEFQAFGLAGTTTPTASQLSGTASANTTASYGNNPNATYAAALDGNTNTFWDAPTASGNYVQLDLGAQHTITSIAFAPRVGFEYRMTGGYFEASNDPSFSSGVTVLYTITSPPADGLTTVNVSATGTFRYVRYVSPAGSYGNIAEMQVFGY